MSTLQACVLPELQPLSESGIAFLKRLSTSTPADAKLALLSLSEETAQEFVVELRVVLRRLVVVEHRAPTGFMVFLRGLADALAQYRYVTSTDDDVEPLVAGTIQWLLSVQGGPKRGPRDTGLRWRCCALLTALLRAAQDCKEKLPTRIRDEVGQALMAHVNDRSADVRLVALDGLAALSPSTVRSVALGLERARHDCDASVRAAAVRFLVNRSREIPTSTVDRVMLDRTPKVRRMLLEALLSKQQHASERDAWLIKCPQFALRALRDRSPGVRTAAVRCLLESAQNGWLDVLSQNLQLGEAVALRLSKVLAVTLQSPAHAQSQRLTRQLSPQAAISMLPCERPARRADDKRADRLAASLFVRITVTTMSFVSGQSSTDGLVPNAITLVPSLLDALTSGDSFEIRQLLYAMLFADLPSSKVELASLARAAAAVLQHAPLEEAQAEFVLGVIPTARLGGWAEKSASVFDLSMSLMKKVIEESARMVCDPPGGHAAKRGEAWFSRAAATALQGIKQMLATTQSIAANLENQWKAWQAKLEDERWASGSTIRPPAAMRQLEIELKDARSACSEQHVRTMLCAVAWLQQSRAPLAYDALQRAALQGLFKPTLEAPDADDIGRAAAILGIATYASKSKEKSLAHWQFFVNLWELQLPQISNPPCEASSTNHEHMYVPLRLAEIAMLFLSDVLLLYAAFVEAGQVLKMFFLFASTQQLLDTICGSQDGCHRSYRLFRLRDVLLDRICCLSIMGRVESGGSAALWLLGHLMADACGAQSFDESSEEVAAEAEQSCEYTRLCLLNECKSLAHAMDIPHAEFRAISCSRTLRFFASLPLLSLAHAELMVKAAESFFALRLWVSTSVPSDTSDSNNSRKVPTPHCRLKAACAIRAVRLVCARLADMPASMGRASLQLRIIQAIAAAILTAPRTQGHSTAIQEALASAVVTAARGDSPSVWAAACEPGQENLMKALAVLLADWEPSTSSKKTERLHGELGQQVAWSTDDTWTWAEHAINWAADLRHDLINLGILSSIPQDDRVHAPVGNHSREGVLASLRQEGGQLEQNAASPTQTFENTVAANWSSSAAWFLVGANGEETKLSLGSSLTLGRRPDCDIIVPSPGVSGKHCCVMFGKKGVELRDFGGRNGTFVNGSRVEQSCCVQLNDKDIVALAGATGPQFTLRNFGISEAPAASSERHDALPKQQDDEGLLASLKPPPFSPPMPTLPRPAKRRRLDPADTVVSKAPAAFHVPEPCLVDVTAGLAHRLPFDGMFTIGRRADCEWMLESSEISGRHCLFFSQDGHVEVVDVSTNGMYINGERLCSAAGSSSESVQGSSRHRLNHGDRINLARRDGLELIFCAKGEAWRSLLGGA